MEFDKVVTERFSVRQFDERKVDKSLVDRILEQSKLCPSAKNSQPQFVYVIESQEGMEKLRQCTKCHFNAPVAFMVCYDSDTSWKNRYTGKDDGDIDAAIFTTYLMLAAQSHGLGTTWVALFDRDKARELFDIPANLVPVALLPTGYKAENCIINSMHFERRDKKDFSKRV